MAQETSWTIRLATDDELREALKADAAGTLAREGVQIPDGVTDIRVVESSPETLYIALPAREHLKEGELTDEELAGAAGGAGVSSTPWDPRTC